MRLSYKKTGRIKAEIDIRHNKHISGCFSDLLQKMGFAEFVSRPETVLRNFVARKWRHFEAGSGVAGTSQLCGHGGHIRTYFGRIQARNGRYDVKTFGQGSGRLTASKAGSKNRLTDI